MTNRSSFLALLVLAALAAGAPVRPAEDPPAARRNIGGPGDFVLRERIIKQLSRDPVLAREAPAVILVNGGVVFSGEVSRWTVKRRALAIAASTRGVVNVTDRMIIRPADLPDEALRKAVLAQLSGQEAGPGLEGLDVGVASAVATLSGTVPDFARRIEVEAMAGTVLGVVRVDNRLRPANAPSGTDDESIGKAVADYLGDFREYPYPGEINIRVRDGVVTLDGRVSYVQARQQAITMAGLVGGVREVDSSIEVDPSVQMPRTVVRLVP